jgi:transglutaminase-like putative cysteine protease
LTAKSKHGEKRDTASGYQQSSSLFLTGPARSSTVPFMARSAWAIILFFLIETLGPQAARAGDPRADEDLAKQWKSFAADPARLDSELDLIAIFEMRDLVGLKKVVDLLKRAMNLPKASVQARERANHLLAQAKLDLGDIEGAQDSYDERGFLADWLVAGPFDNEGGTGIDATYPPEEAANTGFDLKATMEGKERDVYWRAAPKQISHMGYNHLEALFEPCVNTCGFALTSIESDKAGRAVLRIGAGGAFKAYWNGFLSLDDSSYRRPDPDRSAAVVKVERGLNRLLVKVCNEEDRHLGFYARLTDFEAKPWPTRPVEDQTHSAADPVKKGMMARRLAQPLDLLLLRAEKNPENADNSSKAARFLLSTGAIDKPSHSARNLARSACNIEPSAEGCLLWSKLADDRNEQRFAIERARSAEPESIEALLAMARLEMQGTDPMKASPFIDKALSLKPGDLRSRILIAEMLASSGFVETAFAAAKDLFKKHADAPLVVETAADLAQSAGQARAALALVEQALEIEFNDIDKHEISAKAALARKDLDTFERHLAAIDRLAPFDKDTYEFKSEILNGAGYVERAEQTLRTRTEIARPDADAWRDLGLFLMKHGREEEGLDALEKAADLRPQDAWIADYLAHVSPKPRFEEPFVVPPEIFLKERGLVREEENERLLVDQTVVRVFESGLSSRFRQVAAEVKTREGAREWRRRWIQFSPSDQRVVVRQARVFRKDGSVENSVSAGIIPISEPWYRLYYDIEAEIIEMPPLAPGDVVELSYRIDDIAHRNVFNDYFGDFVFIEEEAPKNLWRYVLIAPSTRRFFFNQPKYERLIRNKEEKGNLVQEMFEAHDIGSIKSEYSMPGLTSAASYLHVSTYSSWEDLGKWYRNLIRHQLTPDARIREKVAELIKNAASDIEKVEAVYKWVVSATRYIGLEFGIHGYKPYRAPLVVSRGFGDCKDKASLLVSMLGEAGVQAEFALVRTSDLGDIDDFPSSLAVFNHAIVYVPALDIWLDGTAEHFGPLDLPFGDQGAPALRICKGDAVFARTPIMPPERNTTETSLKILLDPDGDAQIKARASVGGNMAAQLRQQMEALQTRRERFEALLAQTFPGARLGDLDFESLDDLSLPVAYRYTAFVPAFAKSSEGAIEVPIDIGLNLQETYGRLGSREHDLAVGPLNISQRNTAVKIPEGFDVGRLPSTTIIESKFGRLSTQIRRTAGSLSISRLFELTKYRVSKEEYPEFIDFCRRIDDALKERIYLERVR